MLATLLLVALAAVLFAKKDQLFQGTLQPFGFSPMQWAIFMTLLTTASLVMHTQEVLGPGEGYWFHFPLVSLLQRGEFPPTHPFLPDLKLGDPFGRDYLVALLSWLSGGGLAQLSATWLFHHSLLACAFFLSFGLGRRQAGTAGGFLMSSLIFFGISRGDRVGLADTYDGSSLLIYVLLLLLLSFESQSETSTAGDLFLGLTLTVTGLVEPRLMLLFLLLLWLGPLLWPRGSQSRISPRAWLRPLLLSAGSGLFAALSYLPQSSAQATEFSSALNLSSVLATSAWLPLYLGLPAGLWLLRQRADVGGMFYSLGLGAGAVCLLWDLSSLAPKQQFFWEFTTGFGFAGALAVALALLWQHGGWKKAAVVVLAVAASFPGASKVNRNLSDISKLPAERAALAHSPFYPSPQQWLVGSEQLAMTPGLIEASLELQARARPGERLLSDLACRSAQELLQESTVIGLSAVSSMGHAAIPPGTAPKDSPSTRSAAWSQLWEAGEVERLPSMGARWLLTTRPETAAMLRGHVAEEFLKEIESFGEVTLWRYLGPFEDPTHP